jgi:hypothetical protein
MFIIYLSEANINTLISGLLVLSGVAIAPLIAFFTTLFTRKYEETLANRKIVKPTLDTSLGFMFEIIQRSDYVYKRCDKKYLNEISNELFPLNFIMSMESKHEKISEILINGFTNLPKRVLKNSSSFYEHSEILINYLKDEVIQDNHQIDLVNYTSILKIVNKYYKKTLKYTRRYLGVK